MLQRASGLEADDSECDDPMVTLVCNADPENSLCPEACRPSEEPEENDDPVVVKAGDLVVTAEAAAGRKILINGVSDLDTLTFRSSEPVEMTKVILERYGYSQNADVKNIRLEDENGNMITEKKQLDSKGQAKLSIKKDYRTVDGTYNATIVVEATGTGGNTMWFKVVKDGVESTAENLNVDNYKPYTYDMVAYQGATVTFIVRGTNKDYNYEAGEAYEVSKFKVKAPADSAILVRGFTLTNKATSKVDVEEYLDEAVVLVDGKEIKADYSVNRDEQLVIAFDDVEVAAKQSVEFVVKASFADDFDDYGNSIKYAIDVESDFSAVDAKTESRVKPEVAGISWPTYKFLGGKVKLSNVKVGAQDAAYGSEDVKIAEWTLSTTEALKGSFTIYATNAVKKVSDEYYAAIESMKVTIAGEEYEVNAPKLAYYDATTQYNTWDIVVVDLGSSTYEIFTAKTSYKWAWDGSKFARTWLPFTFSNVDIEKSGKVTVKVDVKDMSEFNNQKVSFSTLNADAFSSLAYDEVRNSDAKSQIAGFVTLYNLTVQPAKSALKNNLSKEVEFIKSETTSKVVFDGTYTAKNGTVSITDWKVTPNTSATAAWKVTFYLSIDGEEVDDMVIGNTAVSGSFSNFRIEELESVPVVVTAEVEGTTTGSFGTYRIEFVGEDENGNSAGSAKANTIALKVVEKASISVSASASRTLLRKAAGETIAQFTIKPSKGDSADLEQLSFALNFGTALDLEDLLDEYDVTVTIGDNSEEEYVDLVLGDNTTTKAEFSATPNITIPSAGKVVKVTLDREVAWVVTLNSLEINSVEQPSRTFVKRFEDAIVRVVSQNGKDSDFTKYEISVDADSDVEVSNLKFYINSGATCTGTSADAVDTAKCAEVASLVNVNDGDTLEADNGSSTQSITAMYYEYQPAGGTLQKVLVLKSKYEDFFKVGGDALRVFSNN